MPLLLALLAFSFALWLGLYLLARDVVNPRLRWTGLGLVTYALAIACQTTASFPGLGSPPAAEPCKFLLLLPAIFWTGALIALLPETSCYRRILGRIWLFGQLPIAVLLHLFLEPVSGTSLSTPSIQDLAFALVILLPLLVALVLTWRLLPLIGPRRPAAILLTGFLFFTLATGLLLTPLTWLPNPWLTLSLGIDLILLGFAIAALDAFDQGQALIPDFIRSFSASHLTALAFGGLVGLTIALGNGMPRPMLALLLAVIALAHVSQIFTDPLQRVLDRLVWRTSPGLSQERAELRETASAVPKVNPGLKFNTLQEKEWVKLTRQAISNYGNLPRLAASPLTYHPAINARLAAGKAADNSLIRATILKQVLTEAISHLKPSGEAGFGDTEEWRFYNALYFPYVAGLRPYSRRTYENLKPEENRALDWFRAQVPERTLYNWQTAGTRLVAQYIQELV
jgi:hypothetical protein